MSVKGSCIQKPRLEWAPSELWASEVHKKGTLGVGVHVDVIRGDHYCRTVALSIIWTFVESNLTEDRVSFQPRLSRSNFNAKQQRNGQASLDSYAAI